MGGTSTVYAFEQALLANLGNPKLHPNLVGVQLLAGPPTSGQAQHGEFIMVGNASGGQQPKTFPYNAPTSKDETYTLDMLINVVQAFNADHSALTDRAVTLLAEVEDELRTNPSQDVPYVLWAEAARSFRVEKAMNPTAGWRETLIRSTLYVRARV